jgi:hypothetical protein
LKQSCIWLAISLIALAFAPSAFAADEQGDAGDVPASAQDLTLERVETLSGTIATGNDADLYRICLTGGGTFSATTVGLTEVNTQLFLFDSSGLGIYAHDDGTTKQSTLPAGDPLTPTAFGEYILGISAYDRDPQSADGPIFGNVAFLTDANGRGAGAPVGGWAGLPRDSGPYTIALTGTRSCDVTPPVVDLRSPVDGDIVSRGAEVVADFSCSDEGGSGLVSCEGSVPDGATLDTSTPGPRSFTVTATDGAGNTASRTVAYDVVPVDDFRGFRWPVEDFPALNRWTAGEPVPVRFSLGGYWGLDVLAPGYPQVAVVDCAAGEQPFTGRPARSVSWHKRLRYRHPNYVFKWRTERDWSGDCRQFLLKLKDGSVHRAEFRFVHPWWGRWHRWDD